MPPRTELGSHQARALVDDAVREMSAKLDESATAVTDSIHQACAEIGEGLYLATRQSTRANLGLVTTMVARHAEPTAFTAPEEALSYARSYAHEGLGFDLLTRVYREGEHAYTRLWLEQLQAHAGSSEELAGAMGFFSDWLFAFIGAINQPLSRAYAAERERLIRGGVAMRAEEVRAILGGAQIDITRSSSRLRYRLDSEHIAFVIWSEGPGDDAAFNSHETYDAMDRLAGEVVEQLAGTSALVLPIGSAYAGWVAVAGASRPELTAPTSGTLRIAFGNPARGVEGFRRSHHEAQLARRVGSLYESDETGAVSFQTIALDSLLTHDLDEARRFVHSELGPLIDESDSCRRLATTLEVFLCEQSSYVAAARRLGVHENTVAYRVRRAEELLGRGVGERQLELRTALRLSHLVRAARGQRPA